MLHKPLDLELLQQGYYHPNTILAPATPEKKHAYVGSWFSFFGFNSNSVGKTPTASPSTKPKLQLL